MNTEIINNQQTNNFQVNTNQNNAYQQAQTVVPVQQPINQSETQAVENANNNSTMSIEEIKKITNLTDEQIAEMRKQGVNIEDEFKEEPGDIVITEDFDIPLQVAGISAEFNQNQAAQQVQNQPIQEIEMPTEQTGAITF